MIGIGNDKKGVGSGAFCIRGGWLILSRGLICEKDQSPHLHFGGILGHCCLFERRSRCMATAI